MSARSRAFIRTNLVWLAWYPARGRRCQFGMDAVQAGGWHFSVALGPLFCSLHLGDGAAARTSPPGDPDRGHVRVERRMSAYNLDHEVSMGDPEPSEVERKTFTEWRVETEDLEDDFGTDEAGAREWLAHCESNPDWAPAVLMSRTVITETTAWERA